MILRALTLGLCLAGLTACSASQNLLARGVAVAVDDDSVVPKTSQGFPPRFAALVQDTATPALLLTVENRAQTGRMPARGACERCRYMAEFGFNGADAGRRDAARYTRPWV